MKIRMLIDMPEGASRNGEPWPAKGKTVELLTAEAAHLIASGVAEEVVEEEAPAPKRGRKSAPAETGEG